MDPSGVHSMAGSIDEFGVLVVLAAVFIILSIWQNIRSNKQADYVLKRLLEGDGNGGASLDGLRKQISTNTVSLSKLKEGQEKNTHTLESLDAAQKEAKTTLARHHHTIQELTNEFKSRPCVLGTPGCPVSPEDLTGAEPASGE